MPKALKEEDGKRYSLSARTTLELNLALKDAAQKNGRSVSQEIEYRLEQSFASERIEAEIKSKTPMRPFDSKTEALLRSIQLAAGTAMTKLDASWVDNIYARAAVRAAINGVFKSYIASNKIDLQSSDLDVAELEHANRIGQAFGLLMGDSSGLVGGASLLRELKNILSPNNVGLGDVLAPDELRRDVALRELNASIAA